MVRPLYLAAALLAAGGCQDGQSAAELKFVERAAELGLVAPHAYAETPDRFAYEQAQFAGGVAAGDVDRDGWIDLYTVGGTGEPDRLFRNTGDGRFVELAAASGLALSGRYGSGPTFADLDGDGWQDLLVPGVLSTPLKFMRNDGNGRFVEATEASGLAALNRTSNSVAVGDVDRDGDLDLLLSHWGKNLQNGDSTQHLWLNDGHGVFTDASETWGISQTYPRPHRHQPDFVNVRDYSFAPAFADIDGDAWPDLLITGDFGTSQVLRNLAGAGFEDITTPVIDDENGMGAAVGDYDNDGDLDWFVSSIFDPGGQGRSGNRLYRNDGGHFSEVSEAAGLRHGYWGWGACFGDFDNDGWLDVFHVNGFGLNQPADFEADFSDFVADPSRLFLNNGDGSFRERALDTGLEDRGNGRGVVCFDYDRDGDLDIFVANNQQLASLWVNERCSREAPCRDYLRVRLTGPAGNADGVGARIELQSSGGEQVRELRCGSNFASQNPLEAHFGLGQGRALSARVLWPDGTISQHARAPAHGEWRLRHPAAP